MTLREAVTERSIMKFPTFEAARLYIIEYRPLLDDHKAVAYSNGQAVDWQPHKSTGSVHDPWDKLCIVGSQNEVMVERAPAFAIRDNLCPPPIPLDRIEMIVA